MHVTFVNASRYHHFHHVFPCHLLSEPWPWSCSGPATAESWVGLISSLCWSLGRLWRVGHSASLGKGRMETLGCSGGVEGVLRIEGKGGERVLKEHQWYTWPGADLGLHQRALHWDEHTEHSGVLYMEWSYLHCRKCRVLKCLGFPGGASGKGPACQCRRLKRHGFDPWVRKSPRRRAWQPTPVSLPGESHGQRCLAGYSPQGGRELDMTGVT